MVIKDNQGCALILVGGYGTRLRPLTLTTPKPLIPFVNKPILVRMIESLYENGIHRIILATSSRDPIMHILEDQLNLKGLKLIFSYEDYPLGTAGPILNAAKLLTFPCFVLNSDIICKYPFKEMMEFHIKTKATATILATTVKEPEKYGVLVKEGESLVKNFDEKPTECFANLINAGVYIIEKDVVILMEEIRSELRKQLVGMMDNVEIKKLLMFCGREDCTGDVNDVYEGEVKEPIWLTNMCLNCKKSPRIFECSIEKEVFPLLAKRRLLHVFDLKGYWMDIGQPKDYLLGVNLFLENEPSTENENLLIKNVMNLSNVKDTTLIKELFVIDKSSEIGKGCLIGPYVVIGKNVKVGDNVRIINSTIFDNVKIGDGCYIKDSIVGPKSILERWVRLDNLTVLGSDDIIDEGICLNNCVVLPYKRISKGERSKTIM